MPNHAASWLALLQEQAASHRLDHIDLLLDGSGMEYPLWQSLADLETQPDIAPLLDDTPEQALAQQGPILLRLQWNSQEHQHYLQRLFDALCDQPRLLALFSRWGFSELSAHLRHYTQAEWNQGRASGLLRYWDPRLILAVSTALSPQQARLFHAPTLAWHWLDRDTQPRQLMGQPSHPGELPQPLPPLLLSNEQIAELLAWLDAEDYRALTCAQPQEYGLPNRETLQQHLVRAHLDANRLRIFAIEERKAHVRRWLIRNSPITPGAAHP